MIPQIFKTDLSNVKTTPKSRKEIARIMGMKRLVDGFKFTYRGSNCVAIGKRPINEFDVIATADKISSIVGRGGAEIDRICFYFTSFDVGGRQ